MKYVSNEYVVCENYVIIKIPYKNQFYSIMIDIDDEQIVRTRHWRLSKKRNKLYVISGSYRIKTAVYLHNFILGTKTDYKTQIDHINGNSLDNRRINLRIVNRIENIKNSRVRMDNKTTRIRGISKNKNGKYIVDFYNNGRRYYFKLFSKISHAIYLRYLLETNISNTQICINTPGVKDVIIKLSEKEKHEIYEYFKSKT